MASRKRSSSIRSSATIVGGSNDLLMEIFLLLPVKPLIRFQVVNKQWHSLISARSFSRAYTLNHHRRSHCPKPQPSLILDMITYGSDYFICHPTMRRLAPLHSTFVNLRILQSGNGLLLVQCSKSEHGREKAYYVFNPTTKRSRDLFIKKAYSGLCLVFDPSKSRHYKVICFNRKESYTRILIYNSETRRWNKRGILRKGPLKFHDGIYFNDNIYFIRAGRTSCYFSLSDESIYSIPDPPRVLQAPGCKSYYTIESNEHLYWIARCSQSNCVHVYELEMNGNDCSWPMKYNVDLKPISDMIERSGIGVVLLGIIRGEKEEDSILMLHVPGKIVKYRFVDRVVEEVVDFRGEKYYNVHGCTQFEFSGTRHFTESLVPV